MLTSRAQVPLDRFVLAGTSLEPPHVPLSRAETKSWEDTCAVLKSSGARVSDVSSSKTYSAAQAPLTKVRAQTSDGFLPVTSLASMAPALSIVQIPDGDYETYMRLLYLNINLRRCASRLWNACQLLTPVDRLGLGGRSGLRLAEATFVLSLVSNLLNLILFLSVPHKGSTSAKPSDSPSPPPASPFPSRESPASPRTVPSPLCSPPSSPTPSSTS